MNLFSTSIETWLNQNTAWLTPLAAVVAAVASVGTVLAALYISSRANRIAIFQGQVQEAQLKIEAAERDIAAAQREIAQGQKEIAGLAELSKIDQLMNERRFLEARRGIACGYLTGSVERKWAFELLDLMDQVSIYESENLISVPVLTSLYSGRFICWWYASFDLAQQYRDEMQDPPLWIGAQELIVKMHNDLIKQSPDWAHKPNDELMRKFFIEDLGQADRQLGWLSNGSTGSST